MSDAFFQAAITANALLVSVGGLLAVNAMKENSTYSYRKQIIGLYVGQLVLGIVAILFSLAFLATSTGSTTPLIYWVPILIMSIANLCLFAFYAGRSLKSFWPKAPSKTVPG